MLLSGKSLEEQGGREDSLEACGLEMGLEGREEGGA